MHGDTLHQVVDRAIVQRVGGQPHGSQVVAVQVVRLVIQVREAATLAQDGAGVTRVAGRNGHVTRLWCRAALVWVAVVVVLD